MVEPEVVWDRLRYDALSRWVSVHSIWKKPCEVPLLHSNQKNTSAFPHAAKLARHAEIRKVSRRHHKESTQFQYVLEEA